MTKEPNYKECSTSCRSVAFRDSHSENRLYTTRCILYLLILGIERRICGDDTQEKRLGRRDRVVLHEAVSCRAAHRRPGRREGALDRARAPVAGVALQHYWLIYLHSTSEYIISGYIGDIHAPLLRGCGARAETNRRNPFSKPQPLLMVHLQTLIKILLDLFIWNYY